MKLTANDKKLLTTWGYPENDFEQIEEAIHRTTYTLDFKTRLSPKAVVERLGRETFLSGIAQSTVHWTAVRADANGHHTIHFDSSSMFK